MVTCLKEWFRLEFDDVTNNGVFVTDEITTFFSSVVLNFFSAETQKSYFIEKKN